MLPSRELQRSGVAQHTCDPARIINDIRAGITDPGDITFAEELQIRRWCRERFYASAAEIQSLVDRGHNRRARRARALHLAKQGVLLHAALIATRRHWPLKSSLSPEEKERRRKHRLRTAFEGLSQVGNFKRPAKVFQRARAKNNGGIRIISSFNWLDMARQYVLKSALTPFANLHSSQFMLARDPERRGPAAVRNSLLTALNECDRDSVFMQFDVVDFYGSISHRWIEESIGLDHYITQRHIHQGGMNILNNGDIAVVRAQHEANERRGRWAIPQGSCISPLIAEQAMASVLRSAAVFEELPTFGWSDNLGMIVPRSRRSEVECLVRHAFASHDAGPFNLTVKVNPVGEEFKFLGCWYRKDESRARAYIPYEVWSAWEASVASQIAHCHRNELNAIERYIDAKLVQWQWCEDVNEARDHLRALIQDRRDCPDD